MNIIFEVQKILERRDIEDELRQKKRIRQRNIPLNVAAGGYLGTTAGALTGAARSLAKTDLSQFPKAAGAGAAIGAGAGLARALYHKRKQRKEKNNV